MKFGVEKLAEKTFFLAVFLLTSGPSLCSQLDGQFGCCSAGQRRSKVILDTHTESYTVTSNLSPAEPCAAPKAKQGERKRGMLHF